MNIDGNYFFGQEHIINKLEDHLKSLRKDQGGILFIEGDTGSGKTNILQAIRSYIEKTAKDIRVAQTEVQVPIASLKVASIQPFQPFISILEELDKPDNSAKTKLAQNIGLTVLASLPIVDTFAYAYKEINRDIKQFHQDQKVNKSSTSNSIYSFFLEKIEKLSKGKKLVFIIDNMHWSDPQSIEFLNAFIEHNCNAPFFIICTYREFILETQGLPLISIIHNENIKNKIELTKLLPLKIHHIKELAKLYFKNYKSNREFEEWLLEKSDGNPGMINEYLKYFSKYSPFNEVGELVMNFKDNEYLPSTWSAVFSQQIEVLTDEEKHILTICSAEGTEFTAYIVSQLLATDVLDAIKKLRSIQNKTGFIKSIGPQQRYGLKTTTYKFSQVFYHTFFENLLEYEEKIELHSKISDILKLQFQNTNDEDLKNQIAPYIAAHSMESGDSETANEMLYYTANYNKELGGDTLLNDIKNTINTIEPNATDVIESINQLAELSNISSITPEDEISNYSNDTELLDFNNIRKSVVNDIIKNQYHIVISKLNMYLQNYTEYFNDNEKIQLYTILSKSFLDINKYPEALQNLKIAEKLSNENIDKNTIAYLYCTYAIYYLNNNDYDNALNYLEKNAEISSYLSADAKILTSTLIAKAFKNTSDTKYLSFKEAALKLSDELNYSSLSKEITKY